MLSFTSYLNESVARLDVLRTKYESKFKDLLNTQDNKWRVHMGRSSTIEYEKGEKAYLADAYKGMFNYIVDVDPSGNQFKYAEWLLLQVAKYNLWPEDTSKVAQALQFFYNNTNEFVIKDIGKFTWKTLLTDVIKKEEELAKQREDKGFDIGTIRGIKDIKIVLDTPSAVVAIPETETASRIVGKNTKWCTAYPIGRTWFDDYDTEGPLFVFALRMGDGKFRRYQYHSAHFEYMFDQSAEDFEHLFAFETTTQAEQKLAFLKRALMEWREHVQCMNEQDQKVPTNVIMSAAKTLAMKKPNYAEYFIPGSFDLDQMLFFARLEKKAFVDPSSVGTKLTRLLLEIKARYGNIAL